MPSSVVVSSSSRTRSALESFFTPASVAVIGATEREGSVGRTILENLVRSSYRGRAFAVNLRHSELLGIKCYSSVAALPEPVDLAVIVTPAATVPGVVRECVDAGTRSAIVISAGFKERGAEGVELERLITTELRRGSMRLVGPNCLGMMNPSIGLNATFAHDLARSGNVAFLSQSGALLTAVLDWSLREQVGFSAIVSTGSLLDVDWGGPVPRVRDPDLFCGARPIDFSWSRCFGSSRWKCLGRCCEGLGSTARQQDSCLSQAESAS